MTKPRGAMSSPYSDQKFVDEMIGVVDKATEMHNPKPPPPAIPKFNNNPVSVPPGTNEDKNPLPIPSQNGPAPISPEVKAAIKKLKAELLAAYAVASNIEILTVTENTVSVRNTDSNVLIDTILHA